MVCPGSATPSLPMSLKESVLLTERAGARSGAATGAGAAFVAPSGAAGRAAPARGDAASGAMGVASMR
jgi:hypothetical protein